MALILQNLAPASNVSSGTTQLTAGDLGRGAPTIWTYLTEDTHATVDTAGYFDGASSMLKVCDLIDVVVVAAGAVSTYGRHIVLSNAAGVVDVSDVTVGTVADTD